MPNKFKQIALLSAAFTLIVFSVLYGIRGIPEAEATGDAFKDTKHGGGTVDGFSHFGVDRSAGPDAFEIGFYYYEDMAGEAGKYKSGECNHCHEPHASFGGSEPAPSTGGDSGPDLYLLMSDYSTNNFNSPCVYCHNALDVGKTPGIPPGYGYWGFYQGETIFNASSHGSKANVRWPGIGSLSGPDVFPRNIVRTNTQQNACVNCHTPHGLKGSSGSEFDVGAVPSASQGDTGLRGIDTAYMIPRMLIAWEEDLCLNCHDSDGPAVNTKDVEAQFTTLLSRHPVGATAMAGRHNVKEHLDVTNTGQITGSSVYWNSVTSNSSTGTRHVECVDCHNPHAAQEINTGGTFNARRTGGTASAARSAAMIRIRGPLLGSWGAVPKVGGSRHEGVWASLGAGYFASNWPSPAADGDYPTPTVGRVTTYEKVFFNDTTSADMYEAYLCLKCHSYFAWGTDNAQTVGDSSGTFTYIQTDVTTDFNPRNYGYHPIFSRGQNRPTNHPGNFDLAFVGSRGIYSNSYLTCTDCHNSSSTTDANGPHGSANTFILRSNEVGTTGGVFCHNCHNYLTYGDGGTCDAGSCAYSRAKHIPSGQERVWESGNLPGNGMPAIACMECHGGARTGGLHGSNEGDIAGHGSDNTGERLLNGASWSGNLTADASGGPISCWTSGTRTGYTNFNNCGKTHSNTYNSIDANYTYTYTHYDP